MRGFLGRALLDGVLVDERVPIPLRRALIMAGARLLPRAPATQGWAGEYPYQGGAPPSDWLAARRRAGSGRAVFAESLVHALAWHAIHLAAFRGGDFVVHWGDAWMYGPSALLAYARRFDDDGAHARALELLGTIVTFETTAARSPMRRLADAERTIMGTIGAIRSLALVERLAEDSGARGGALDRASVLAFTRRNLRFFDGLFHALGDSLEIDLGLSLGALYGTATPSGLMALLHLAAAPILREQGAAGEADRCVGRAQEILRAVRRRSYLDDRGWYRFRPGEERIHLYPNNVLALANVLAFEATGDRALLDHARALVEGVEPLRDTDRGGWYTPYWYQERHGTYGTNAKSLSGQNYMIAALARIHRTTRERSCVERVREAVAFVERDLFGDGMLWHDVFEGARAKPGGPSPFCTGCNLQTLAHLLEIDEDPPLVEELCS